MCKLRRKVEDMSGQRDGCEKGGLSVGMKTKPSSSRTNFLTGLVFHFPPQPAHWCRPKAVLLLRSILQFGI
jgi:hypothetical protein